VASASFMIWPFYLESSCKTQMKINLCPLKNWCL
jgi:hypothetical protein